MGELRLERFTDEQPPARGVFVIRARVRRWRFVPFFTGWVSGESETTWVEALAMAEKLKGMGAYEVWVSW